MPGSRVSPLLIVLVCLIANVAWSADRLPKGVACLLDENAAGLLPQLTNPGGDGGQGEVEKDVVFSGKSGIKITVYQRYFNLLPGWAYRITEHPQEGQYRYLRFAWKSDGLTGIMLQLHDDKDWNIRYAAGVSKFGWETKFVADTLPQEWKLVTVDLFKDFGEREIHGIALTAFDGTAGYFDHIYLARSVAELDAIDATGLGAGPPLTLTAADVERHWKQLASEDASVAYRSFWMLAAAGESARTWLANKVPGAIVAADDAKIAMWIRDLDDDEYAIREQATARLLDHVATAREALEAELKRTMSAEARARLGLILAKSDGPLSEADRIQQQTRRILQIIAERTK